MGRLDPQKGVHLIRHALFCALANDAQFVLLGSGSERAIDAEFWQLKRELNDNPDCHLEIGFDEDLAHLIYAGADFVVMPSLLEPCGLTQMIALRYGTVPVVRACGGLADTVFDWDHSPLPRDQRNGFVFDHADHAGHRVGAAPRAAGSGATARRCSASCRRKGMRCDYSWRLPAQSYLDIYDFIRHR